MLDFTIEAEDLKRSVKLLLSGRRGHAQEDVVDFDLAENKLTLSSTGIQTETEVSMASAGNARVPLKTIREIKRLLPTFGLKKYRMKIEAGGFKLESFAVKDDRILVKSSGPRKLDWPVNLSAADVLALSYVHPACDIEESGLSGRVDGARRAMQAAIDKAVDALKPLDIERDLIHGFVHQYILHRAKKFKVTSSGE